MARRATLGLFLLFAAAVAPVYAQGYPRPRPITLVVPLAADQPPAIAEAALMAA